MMTPEVSRFVRDVILRGRSHATDGVPPDDLDGALAAMNAWDVTEDRIIEAGRVSPTVADLPPWVLDLAEHLGVERPA